MTPGTSDQRLAPGSAPEASKDEEKEYSKVLQPFQKKPNRFKKDGTPYKPRRGWGPYRSVPNERAAAFNLQLDVQTLQQEVRNLTALRDILKAKSMVQRHSPEGTLMHVVREYFRVFRTGFGLEESKGQEQREFLHSITDAQVEVGIGLQGPDVMMYQLKMYSTLMRWIQLKMNSVEIVEADDSVVIKANATLRFQVLRETIEMVFPHVMGNAWLVSQLVGQELEPNMGITFVFNSEGKCCKLDVETDFVGAFMRVVKDPEAVEMLLGRALIADNCMLGMNHEEKEAALASDRSEFPNDLRAECDFAATSKCETGAAHSASTVVAPLGRTSQSSRESVYDDAHRSCRQVVKDYYLAFGNGFLLGDSADLAIAFQRDFLLHRFVLQTAQGNCSSTEYVANRWRSLSRCFSVLSFLQDAVVSSDCYASADTCTINSSARYILQITPTSIQSVFPHLVAHSQLCETLLGEVLAVPSQICFSVESVTGRIFRVEERMDFRMAMRKLVKNRQELEFILSEAKLAVDGVSFKYETTASSYPDRGRASLPGNKGSF